MTCGRRMLNKTYLRPSAFHKDLYFLQRTWQDEKRKTANNDTNSAVYAYRGTQNDSGSCRGLILYLS